MVNRTALAALLLALSGPSWAAGEALKDARALAGGNASIYDKGCSGGSCGAQAYVCTDEACEIEEASKGALQQGGLVVAPSQPRQAMVAEVPAPSLNPDKPGAKDRPGFFKKHGLSLAYGLGGAAAGAGIGWLVGGPIGAVLGGLIGAGVGFFLSKLLSR